MDFIAEEEGVDFALRTIPFWQLVGSTIGRVDTAEDADKVEGILRGGLDALDCVRRLLPRKAMGG